MPRTRGNGEGGLYELKGRGLWRGTVDLGYGPDGRRIQKTVTARTKSAARAKLDALKDEIREFGAPLSKTLTVKEWAEHWLDTVVRPTGKPNTTSAYSSIIRNWIIPQIGSRRTASLVPSDVRKVLKAITDAGRSTATASKAYFIMSGMFEDARRDGKMRRNVTVDVDHVQVLSEERGALTTEQVLRVLQIASQQWDGTRWWATLFGGLRQGERLGATIDSIDFHTDVFTVQWELSEVPFAHGCGGDCGYKRPGSCPHRRLAIPRGLRHRQLQGRICLLPPKSGKSRPFPMVKPLRDALAGYLEATEHVPNPHGLIWRNSDGSPITAAQDNEAWRRLLLDAGIITEEQAKPPKDRAVGTPEVPTSHWARHTTVTALMELGVPTKVIAEIVGQATERINERYQHVTSAEARKAQEMLGQRFSLT